MTTLGWTCHTRAAPSCDMFNLGSSYFHVALTTVRHLLNILEFQKKSSLVQKIQQNDIIYNNNACTVSRRAESEKPDGETGRQWNNESCDYCNLWVSAMPAISIVDHRRLFPSLPLIPLLPPLCSSPFPISVSPLHSLPPFPFSISFSPLTTLPLLFPPFCLPFGLVWVEFNAPPDTIEVISEAVFRANHLTDTDKQNNIGKYKQTQNKSEKVNNLKCSKTKLPRFSCLLQHSARERGGLTLQHPRAHTGFCFPINQAKVLGKTCPCDTFWWQK